MFLACWFIKIKRLGDVLENAFLHKLLLCKAFFFKLKIQMWIFTYYIWKKKSYTNLAFYNIFFFPPLKNWLKWRKFLSVSFL